MGVVGAGASRHLSIGETVKRIFWILGGGLGRDERVMVMGIYQGSLGVGGGVPGYGRGWTVTALYCMVFY